MVWKGWRRTRKGPPLAQAQGHKALRKAVSSGRAGFLLDQGMKAAASRESIMEFLLTKDEGRVSVVSVSWDKGSEQGMCRAFRKLEGPLGPSFRDSHEERECSMRLDLVVQGNQQWEGSEFGRTGSLPLLQLTEGEGLGKPVSSSEHTSVLPAPCKGE